MREQVSFDFIDHKIEAQTKLEFILCQAGWGTSFLDFNHFHALLLVRLIHNGYIGVFEYRNPFIREYDEAVSQKAEHMRNIMRKRSLNDELLNMAYTFPWQEHSETYCYAPYFPDLMAFVRCNGLAPDVLVDMLLREDCEHVYVFPGFYFSNEEWVYYAFELKKYRDSFKQIVDKERNKHNNELCKELSSLFF